MKKYQITTIQETFIVDRSTTELLENYIAFVLEGIRIIIPWNQIIKIEEIIV